MEAHIVELKDRTRIRCSHQDCSEQAVYCEHAPFDVGQGAGVSFWYTCTAHTRAEVQQAASARAHEGDA